MRPLIGVIADDLTGGMEAASMLVALGVDCGFVTHPDHVAGVADRPAIVVAQKTRVAPVDEAVRNCVAAAHALLETRCRQLFFKYCATFDSTDEGNIGPVSDALLALTRADRTAFCPTSVEMSRSVFNGYLFYGRPLVSDSAKRFDPLTPMTDPDLVRVLQRQSALKVGLIQHSHVRSDAGALAAHVDALVAAGHRHLIADAIYAEDLDAIAALAVDWRVMTGNSPILEHYLTLWRAKGRLAAWQPGTRPIAPVGGAGVVLAGSCADRTLEQIAAFERERSVLRIDLATAGNVRAAVSAALDWATGRLDAGPVAITTSAGPDAVAATQAQLGRDGAARLAEDLLGSLAVELHRKGGRRFLVAGGETSGAVIERLGASHLRIGAYGGPGIARATTEGADPIAFSLKSGKLGPVDMFLPVLAAMASGAGPPTTG